MKAKEKNHPKKQDKRTKKAFKASEPVGGEAADTQHVVKIKRSKYKCATTGKYECDRCGKPINRGETIRLVSVRYEDALEDKFSFCSKECRDEFCDTRRFPLK